MNENEGLKEKWPGTNDKETSKRQDIIVSEVLKSKDLGISVLNVGDTRKGFITVSLKDKGFDVSTIDIFEDADVIMDFDRKQFPDKFYGKFDFVTAGEIIEHIVYTDIFLDEIYKSLKDSGILVLSFPNICCLKNRVKMIFGKFPTYGAAKLVNPAIHNDDKFHVRDFNLQVVKQYLTEHKFKVLETRTNGIYVRDIPLVPGSICPPTLGNQIIIKAAKIK